MRRRQLLMSAYFCCTAVLTLAVPRTAWSHEGHAPIPTKGITVKGNTILLSPDARRAIGLKIVEVTTRDVDRTILAAAVVVLQPQAHAYATTPLAGRIEKVLVGPGQAVRADETLALVRSLELERLRAAVRMNGLESELARQNLSRAEELAQKELIPERDLAAARLRKQEWDHVLLVSQLKIQALGLKPEDESAAGLLPIRSPIAGIVAHVDITPGAMVDGQMHPLEILDPSRLWVRADVPEAYVREVALDNPVDIQLSGHVANRDTATLPADPVLNSSRRFQGVVRARQGSINGKTLTEPVWIEIVDPPPSLTPGLTGLARIVVERRSKAVLTPELAVIRDGMESYVFVQTEPGKYERTRIVTGLRLPGYVQAVSGLFSIDSVVTHGSRQLASFFIQGVLRPSPEAKRSTGLRVESVQARTISSTVTLDAVVELPPRSKTMVASPVMGRVTELMVSRPEEVSAGRPLARLVSLEVQNMQLELIQATLAAQLHQQHLETYRKADPEQKGIISRSTVQEAETKWKIAVEKLGSLRQQLQTIGMTDDAIQSVIDRQQVEGSLVLRAPRKGHVIPQTLILGQIARAAEPLFEIQDRSQVWVRGQVFEQDLSKVRPGQTVRVRLPSDPDFLAERILAQIAGLPEADGRTRAVWVEMPNTNGALRENQLARLTLSVGPPVEVLAVPLSALVQQGSKYSVFVLEEKENRFSPRSVEIGRRDDRFAEIRAGLKAGEVVAVSAVADLQRGYGRIK